MDVILVAFKSDGSRKEFRVHRGRCVIGRKPECDLRIPAGAVSRQHTEVVITGGKARVRDMGSSNGTFLNDVRVQEADLAPGDRLIVGPVVFVVQIDGQPSHIEPVTSTELPTAAFSDPRSGTKAPVVSPLDESSMIAGAPAMSGDSGVRRASGPNAPTPSVRPAGAGKPAPAPGPGTVPASADADEGDDSDPLSKMISKSKSREESSVFEFDFDDDDDDKG